MPPLGFIQSLPDDRYRAIEEIRKKLKFTKQEWRVFLHALAKTDNGWFEYMLGDITIKFGKVVDIDELKLHIEQNKGGKVLKSAVYIYDLKEFKQTKKLFQSYLEAEKGTQ